MKDSKGFLKFEREEIKRRPAGMRVKDWQEVDEIPAPGFLHAQTARCMDCGVPFCQGETGCPVDNDIPEWNSLAHQGRYQEALARLHATNNFPEFTGRLCPAPCESACVLGINADPVNIKSVEWGIVEQGFINGWIRPEPSKQKTGKKVAIIGSGPAGLAAAQQLARSGHEVTVFEKEKSIGGLLRYGIPDFKMQKSLIDRRLQQLQAEGVIFKTSVCFGKDLSYQSLQQEFDVVALAIGAEKPRDLKVLGRELRGIHFAMDYLKEQNRVVSGEISETTISAKGKKVIILGGGDTGSDCLGTALRQGAKSVLQFEILSRPPMDRDPKTPWPLWPMKLKSSHAHEEGGERHWNLATEAFLGAYGNVTKLVAKNLLDPQEPLIGFEAELVILALGFVGVEKTNLQSIPGLNITPDGKIETAHFMTSMPGVFACGDSKRGASLIVWAISEGRKMAQSIHSFLMG